jgi:hypothetical protein
MSARSRQRAVLLAAVCLILTACKPSLPSGLPVTISVEVVFTEFHSDIQLEWRGEMTSSYFDLPNARETVSPQRQFFADVTPGSEGAVQLPDETMAHPGIWHIWVEGIENPDTPAQQVVLRADCPSVDVGNDRLLAFAPGVVYTLRVIEEDGSGTCEFGAGSLPPLPPEPRDSEAVSLTISSTDPVAAGTPLPVIVQVRNRGPLQEIVRVDVNAAPAAGGSPVWSGSTTLLVDANTTSPAAFTWDTACLPPTRYTVSGTVTMAQDSNAANNGASSSVSLSAARRLDIAFDDDNNTALHRGQPALIRGSLTAGTGNATGESNVQVSITETGATPGNFNWPAGMTFPQVACGQTLDVDVIYQAGVVPPGSENHVFTLAIVSPPAPGNASDQLNVTVSNP